MESEKQYLFQLDYVKPFNKNGKMEAGMRSSLRKMVNDFWVKELADDGNYYVVNGLDNVFHYDERINAAYGILGNKKGRFSYQAGVRTEWTDVETVLKETDEKNPRKYFNVFPSAHFTFHIDGFLNSCLINILCSVRGVRVLRKILVGILPVVQKFDFGYQFLAFVLK